MNTLYNSALRQGTAIRKDLDALADGSDTSPALLGQINASLTSFSRTVDDYNKLAKQELVPEKQQKAHERIKHFRAELSDYRERFDRLKQEADDRQTTQARTELFGRRPHHAATPENPYDYSNASSSTPNSSNPLFAGVTPRAPGVPNAYSAFGASPLDSNRENHALREQSFFQKTHEQIDEFLERGSEVLGNLGQQRDILKGTQRKLYSVGNTLGISGDTIRMVERRARQDKWIFYGGVIVFFVFAYFVIRWFR